MAQGQITNLSMTSNLGIEMKQTLVVGWNFLSARKFSGTPAIELHIQDGNASERKEVTFINLGVGSTPDSSHAFMGTWRDDTGEMVHVYQVMNS